MNESPGTAGAAEQDGREELLHSLGLLDIAVDDGYEHIVALMQIAACSAVSQFSVLTSDRQFFKSSRGLTQRETPIEHAFCAHTLRQATRDGIFVVEDAQTAADFSNNPIVIGPPNIRSYAGMTVRLPNDMPVGAIAVLDTRPRSLDSHLATILRHAKGAIEEVITARFDAVRDGLTGLFNRRHFDDALRREWQRCRRDGHPLTLLYIDVDHFKAFNDTYGHAAGDQALCRVAETLQDIGRRGGDMVARYGGEEFVMLLPDTDGAGAGKVAAQICAAIRALAIPNRTTPTEIVTVSVGGASGMGASMPAASELSARADACLYEIKRESRDGWRIALTADSLG